jgi:hypothetical protein
MKNSNLNDWLIPLLVVLGLYVPLSNVAPSPERRSSEQPQAPAFIQVSPTVTPTPGRGRVSGEAARLLCDYFGFEPRPHAGLNPQQKLEVKNGRGDYCGIKSAFSSKASKHGYTEIEYLIATVPDPIDTRLDHQFDRALDAIRRAIESAEYTFDRYWLPWDRSKTAPPAISPAGPETAQLGARHVRDPGVFLFRASEKKTKENGSEPKRKSLLLLFLVGETTTWGIHKAAFLDALKQYEWLPHHVESKTEATPHKKQLGILGPYFSGSTVSLAIPLKRWMEKQKQPPEVSIITGSTSSIDKKDFLDDLKPAGVSFYSTVGDLEQINKNFYAYLCDLDPEIKSHVGAGQNRPSIAVLTEAGTARGQDVRQSMRPKKKEGRDQDACQNIKKQNEETSCEQPPILSLTYPVHISQLRVEASKSSVRKDVTNAPAVKDADLPLPMSEAGSPGQKDFPPLFSQIETATMEFTLREILTAIRRERIRYVRVSAADPQDRIFLIREIRKYCPNATIFMTSADLLYQHSEYNLDFVGARVISSYPLFALNQLWTYPFEGDKSLQQFPTPVEEGVYNAALALLDRKDLMLEYGFPLKSYKVSDERYPALWVGVVGRNGIWPVKAYDVKPKEKESYTMSGRTCPASSATTSPSSSSPLPLPTTRSEDLSSSATTSSSLSPHRLGLSGNYRSPIGVGFLLLLGFICLLLSLILLAQLSFARRLRQTDRTGPDRPRLLARIRAWIRREWFKMVELVGMESHLARIRVWIEPHLARIRLWISRKWWGQVFGDEEFYCYRPERRSSLMGCCVSLLTVSLFTSGVAILPAWVLWLNWLDESAPQPDWDRHGLIGVVACLILVVTLGAFIWLILMWIIGVWRNFGQRIWVMPALVAGAAMFPFVDWKLSLGSSILLIVSVILWGNFSRVVWVSLVPIVVLAMITFAGWGLYEVLFVFKKPEKIFFFLRATELTSLVSVLLPALLVGLAAFLSFFTALRRLNLAERMPCLRKPRQRPYEAPQFLRFDHKMAKSFEGLCALEDRVKDMIVCHIFKVPGAALITVLISVSYWYFFWRHFIPSVDGRWFDWFFKLAFCAVPLMLVGAMMRLLWLWRAVKQLLQRLSWHPLISQYAAMRSEEKRFSSLPPIDLMTHTTMNAALSFSVLQARSFYKALKPGMVEDKERKRIGQWVETAESGLLHALESESRGEWQIALRKRLCSQAVVAELTKRVTGLLEDSWQAAGSTGPAAKLRDEGRFFLITHVVAFLQHVFAHLQNIISLVTIGLLLMLLAANFYPFQPREPLLLFSWVGILTSVVVTLYILFSANRDKTLSLLARTAPGKVNITRDLVFRVLFHGVIPVIALLGLQFPEAVRKIFTWLNVFQGKGS